MSEEQTPEPMPDLPEELADLDRELLGMRIEVRPSFGPELEAELEREWLDPTPEPVEHGGGRLLAAAAVVLLAVVVAVPPARASFGRAGTTLVKIIEELQAPDPPPVPTVEPGSVDSGADADLPAVDGSTLLPPAFEPGVEQPRGGISEVEAFRLPPATYPELVDREADRRVMREYYPPDLEAAGIGGTVRLVLWIDTLGSVDHVQIRRGSGVPALDRAALAAVPNLRWHPARRRGRPVGTWVEFELTFEVEPDAAPSLPAALDLPEVGPVGAPVEAVLSPAWREAAYVPAPTRMEVRDLLAAAVGPRSALARRFGSLDGLLEGEPPPGAQPGPWREEAVLTLEEATARAPGNPAPYLALARLRRRQGLDAEARRLYERGVAAAAGASAGLAAELNYELGLMMSESWMQWVGLGRIPAAALDPARCAAAGEGPTTGEAAATRLVAWNYLCPAELARVMERAFEPVDGGGAARARMASAFEAAVAADRAHVGANVRILLDAADRGDWTELLNGARRFAWASGGHAYGLLLSGMALQRLGRPLEAADAFELALDGLPAAEARSLVDVRPLLTSAEAGTWDRLDPAGREAFAEEFWARRDPVLSTEVNERRTEHLARAAYAYLRFGGTATDAGRAWVRYGRPDAVRVVGWGTGVRTEFWDYGAGPDLTFQRTASDDTPTLDPAGAAYLADLERVFPHRDAGTSARTRPLPAQVVRFLTGRAAELEVHTSVPAEMADRAASLTLGVFEVGAEGSPRVVVRRPAPVDGSPIRLRVPVDRDAERLVVELHDGATGATAVASPPLTPPVRGRPYASDVLVVEAADPRTRDVRRTDSWVRPALRGDVLEGDEVGLLFELHHLPGPLEPYWLQVSLVPRNGGEAVQVPFRPAGQTLFGTEWSRRPWPSPLHSTEYLTLDLRDVPRGSYRLRVVADLPDGTRIAHNRDVQVR